MEKSKTWKQEIKFHLGLHLLIAVFITIASYVHFPFGSSKGNFVYLVHFLLLHFSLFGFIYIFSLFNKIFKILFPILFIVVSSFSYWVYTQDLTIGVGMIQAILETNIDIAIDVFSYQFIIFLLVSSFSIFYFFKFNKKLRISSLTSPLFFISIIGVLTFFVVENYKYDAFKNRLPYSIYFNSMKYFKESSIKLREVTAKVSTKEENLHVVLVIGESVRSDHLFLNGYNRNTNPLLAQQKNLISFKEVFTPYTFTAQSVPQILTDKSIDNKQKKQEFTSLYSVLNKASFKTEWIGNQSLERSYKDVIYSNTSKTIIDEFHSFLSFKKEKDLALLNYFSLHNNTLENRISTLHMIGSHWYYNNRVTSNFEYFKPITNSKYFGSLEKETLINSYDNTIVYLDFFLNELIQKLKKSTKKTILIYISDHGETLGEDGKWLHAQEHNASKNPAMLVWFSNNFKKSYPLEIQKLISKKQDSITTDFLFHSILDISKIENYKYLKNQSIFN